MIFVKSKILYFLKWPSVAIEENFSGSFKCLFKNKRNKYVRNNLSRFILSVSLILFFFHFVLCSTIENVEILKNDYNTLTESHNIINRRSRNLGANPESISLGYELSEKDEGNKNDLINSATDVSTELENLKERLFPELELYTNDQNSRNNTPNLRKGSLGFDSFKKLELGTLNQFDKDKMINLKDETNMNEFEGSLGRNSMASNVVTSELFDEPVDDSSSTTTSTGTKLQNVPSNDNNGELLKDEPIDDYINNNSKVESEDNYYAQQNMQSQSKDNYASEQEYFDRGEQLNDVSADNNTSNKLKDEPVDNNTSNKLKDEPVDNNTSNKLKDEPVDDNTSNKLKDEPVDNNTINKLKDEPVDDNTSNILKDEPVDDHAGKHLKDEPVDDHAGKHMKDEPVDIDRTNIKKGLNEQHVNPWTTTLADLKNINNSMKIEKNNKSNEQVKNTSVSKSCDIIKPSKFNKKNLFEQRLQSVEGKNFFEGRSQNLEGRSNFDERSQNVEGRSHFDERSQIVEQRRNFDDRDQNIMDRKNFDERNQQVNDRRNFDERNQQVNDRRNFDDRDQNIMDRKNFDERNQQVNDRRNFDERNQQVNDRRNFDERNQQVNDRRNFDERNQQVNDRRNFDERNQHVNDRRNFDDRDQNVMDRRNFDERNQQVNDRRNFDERNQHVNDRRNFDERNQHVNERRNFDERNQNVNDRRNFDERNQNVNDRRNFDERNQQVNDRRNFDERYQNVNERRNFDERNQQVNDRRNFDERNQHVNERYQNVNDRRNFDERNQQVNDRRNFDERNQHVNERRNFDERNQHVNERYQNVNDRRNFDERNQHVNERRNFDQRAPNVEERRYMDPRNPNIPYVRFPHHQWGQGMMYGRPYYPWVPFMGDGRGYNFYNPHQHMVYGRPYYWVPPPPALEYTKGFNPMEQRREEDRGHMGGRGSRYPEEERYNYNNKRSNSIPEGRNYEENAYERGGGNNKWDFRNMYDRLRDEDENDYDQPPSTSSSNRGRGNERYSQSRDRREERNNYNSDYYTRGNERTYNNSNVTSSSNRELIPYKKEILPFGVSNSELEDKLTEEELNERIRRLDYTVSVKDMFILWNHILAHERKKYTKMQEYLMYYSQYLEKTYLVPTAFRKKYWWRVHYMLTEEVVKRERTDNLDFHQFLRKGSCEKREFLYFINSKRKGWADLTETMKNIWMERLTYKMRKYSGA
ncbi:hypothetical protein PFHG_04285 [Plasmodium falciparum HB3]|uniref:Plasmodium RESA N-terminal domain-containing protein n=1 Tax=Plasmodium falciparum (isolate HB3) TaxID=137071 RepID=A0A0L7KHY4_PLAFX|nr:hypothetical protein PFHG_04285 [Plasmodium falciparum HB3]